MEAFGKLMNKQFEVMAKTIMDDFMVKMIENDESVEEEFKALIIQKFDAYQGTLKEAIKIANKKPRAVKDKAPKAPSAYNYYMKEKMAEFSNEDSEYYSLNNNERLSKIGELWANDKATYKPPVQPEAKKADSESGSDAVESDNTDSSDSEASDKKKTKKTKATKKAAPKKKAEKKEDEVKEKPAKKAPAKGKKASKKAQIVQEFVDENNEVENEDM